MAVDEQYVRKLFKKLELGSLEADLARAGGSVRACARECCSYPQCSRPQE